MRIMGSGVQLYSFSSLSSAHQLDTNYNCFQERFRAMAPMYYRGAHAAILVYDITSEESFQDMSSWVEGNELHYYYYHNLHANMFHL